jgi:hypothetical protein
MLTFSQLLTKRVESSLRAIAAKRPSERKKNREEERSNLRKFSERERL